MGGGSLIAVGGLLGGGRSNPAADLACQQQRHHGEEDEHGEGFGEFGFHGLAGDEGEGSGVIQIAGGLDHIHADAFQFDGLSATAEGEGGFNF